MIINTVSPTMIYTYNNAREKLSRLPHIFIFKCDYQELLIERSFNPIDNIL